MEQNGYQAEEAMRQEEDELDLTGSHLHDLAAVELPATLKALDLTLNRLRALDPRILALTGLHTLSLRQNLLTDASQLDESGSKDVLRELVLHDNQLTQVPELRGFAALRKLELSYNQIQSLAPLTSLGGISLRELYAANNGVQKIEAVQQFTDLRLLELGSNKTRQMEGLEGLARLQELWLGRNRIARISGLGSLSSLQKLSLQSNRLTSMDGLAACSQLEELYLSHNGIARLQGLECLPRLKILDVSSNMVEEVGGIDKLHQLQDLWLNDNRITLLEQLAPAARSPTGASLTCLYIAGNACMCASARSQVLSMFSNLQQLDDDMV